MAAPRLIIHLNIPAFAVTVERIVDIRLRQRPVVVAPVGAARALVWDMSAEAYRLGIRKGMQLADARRRCRDVMVVEPHPPLYERAMRAFARQAEPFSPLVERGAGRGHLFLDVSGTGRLFGPPEDVAWRIRRAARRELGFEPAWAVAANKLVAKVATRLVNPAGDCVVRAGDEQTFLSPLPVGLLPGLGRETWLRLRELNLARMGEVAQLSMGQLAVPFGRRAFFLHDAVRGIDHAPVVPEGVSSAPRIACSHLFAEDTNEVDAVQRALRSLVENIGMSLRERNLAAGRLALVLEYSDRVRLARQTTIRQPTASDFELLKVARLLLERAWLRRVRLRRLSLAAERLSRRKEQLSLFGAVQQRDRAREALLGAVDTIRRRFRPDAVSFGIAPSSRP